jgi:hypothetical protein
LQRHSWHLRIVAATLSGLREWSKYISNIFDRDALIAIVQVEIFIVSEHLRAQINSRHAILHPSAGEFLASFCDILSVDDTKQEFTVVAIIYLIINRRSKYDINKCLRLIIFQSQDIIFSRELLCC